MPPRHLTRSARGALLWGLAAFAALQLGLAVAVEGWLPQLRDPYFAYRAARLAPRVAGPDRPFLILVLGSSRVQDGLVAGDLEAPLARALGRPVVVFNFGIPGAGPITNLLNLKRLLARGIHPDLLVVEVLPVTLADHRPEPGEASHLQADRLWRHELAVLGRYRIALGRRYRAWWWGWLVPTHAHRFAILSRLAPVLLPGQVRLDWARDVDASGWREPVVPEVTPEQRRLGLERDAGGHGPVLASFQLGEPSCRAQKDLLRLCQARSIPAALLWMPETAAYRSWYPAAVLAQLRRFLAEVSRDYRAPLIDARAWVGEDGFRDGQHLSRGGATMFTRRFGREVLPSLGVHSSLGVWESGSPGVEDTRPNVRTLGPDF
jgi:hypothetical protein